MTEASTEAAGSTLESRFGTADGNTFKEVFREFGSLVYSFCRRRVGPDVAEDLTQEIFVEVWRKRGRFDPGRGNLGAFIMTVAKSRLIDETRRQARRQAVTQAQAELVVDTTEAAEVDRIADRMLVNHALGSLGPDQRRVVELAFLNGLTQQEIAERTGIPLGTVKSHARRGLAVLARVIGGGSD